MFNDSALAFGEGAYAERNELLQVDLAVYIPIGTFLTFFSTLTIMTLLIIGSLISHQAPLEVSVVFTSFLVFFYFYAYWHFKKMVNELARSVEREFAFWLARSNALQGKQ